MYNDSATYSKTLINFLAEFDYFSGNFNDFILNPE